MSTEPSVAEATPFQRAYMVRLPLFEGPLDLLLHLIEKNELDITAISLALVADQFAAYLRELQEVRADIIADFLVVAARLLLIKSRWLLPKPEMDDEELEEDPGEALARRLRAYKRFKELSEFLQGLEKEERHSYVRVAPPPPMETRLDPEGLSVDQLLAALQDLMSQEPDLLAVDPIVSRRKVTVREKIELIEALVRQGQPVPFMQVVGRGAARIDIVVSLWAVLEMIKQGRIQARQSQLFGEIVLINAPQAAGED
ncbi:MAG: ScpA family protein [Chloroflexota bacterium]|nr:ScpA family protein [Chloroflexota bacterium]